MSDEVVEPKKNEVKKNEKSTALKLTDYKLASRKKELQKLADDYNNLVVTKDTLPEAKKARAKVRAARYEIQGIEKDNNKILSAFKGLNKSEALECYDIIRPTEDKIHGGIQIVENEDARIKAEKEAAEQAEIERIEALDRKVEQFDREGMDRVLGAKALKELDELKTKIDEYDVSPQGSFKEKSPDAFMVKKKLLNEIESRRSVLNELEEARKATAELEELRAKNAQREADQLAKEEEIKLEESKKRDAEIIHMQNNLADLGLTCDGDNFVRGDFSISSDELEKMALLEFSKKLREDIQPKIEAIKIKEKEEKEADEIFQERAQKRRTRLGTLGLKWNLGGGFYGGVTLALTKDGMFDISDKEFDKQFEDAKAKIEVIKKEEKATEEKAKKKEKATEEKAKKEAATKLNKERKEYQDEWIYTVENLSKVPVAFMTLNTEAVEVAITSGAKTIAGLKICQRKNLI